MTNSIPRRSDKNLGVIADRSMPDDKKIVGALVILMAEDGTFSAHVATTKDGYTQEMPDPEVLSAIGGMLADAWNISNL